jgi:hypothetical protein
VNNNACSRAKPQGTPSFFELFFAVVTAWRKTKRLVRCAQTRGESMDENANALTYRHWFFIAMLVFVNVLIFGCVVLAVTGKMYFG